MKAVLAFVLLIIFCFGLAQYYNLWNLERNEPLPWKFWSPPDSVSAKQEQKAALELSRLLKEAMQYGQDGKPTIHLVHIMEEATRPFFMFVCSNCYCDICEKVKNFGYWSPVKTVIFHYILKRSRGCVNGKAVVVDVGAHVGYFSLISASYGCQVVSFEANSEALRYLNLSRAVNNYDRISLHQKGVGQAETTAVYKETDNWALKGFGNRRRKLRSDDSAPDMNRRVVEMEAHSNRPQLIPNYQNLERGFSRRQVLETIDVTMLDNVVDGMVLLLNIATEGYEANVLAGAKNLINRHNVHHILVEVKQPTSPAKRGLLWTIAKKGAYTYVYNWEEFVTPLTVPLRQFRLRNATIVDVTDIVHNETSTAPLLYQDFWFCRHPLPWLSQ